MTIKEAQTVVHVVMDLADVRQQLELCAGLMKGIQERLAGLAAEPVKTVTDVSGQVFPRED
jgi:hypothetical protein